MKFEDLLVACTLPDVPTALKVLWAWLMNLLKEQVKVYIEIGTRPDTREKELPTKRKRRALRAKSVKATKPTPSKARSSKRATGKTPKRRVGAKRT